MHLVVSNKTRSEESQLPVKYHIWCASDIMNSQIIEPRY